MTNPPLRTRNSGYGGSGYDIPTEVVAGKPRNVPGVTTVTGVTEKEALRQYYADAVAARAVVNIDALLNRSQEEGFNFLRWAGNYANKEAIQNGNVVHDWIDQHMTGGFEPALENEAQEQMVAEFLRWLGEHEVEVLCSEETFYNPTVGYAGTGDWIWRITCKHANPCVGEGKPVVVLGDNKTGKNVHKEARQQLAALGACSVWLRQVPEGTDGAVRHETKEAVTWWVEDSVPVFEEYAVLHIRPAAFDPSGREIPAFCELQVVPHWRIDLAWGGFLGAYALKDADRREALEEKRLAKEMQW